MSEQRLHCKRDQPGCMGEQRLHCKRDQPGCMGEQRLHCKRDQPRRRSKVRFAPFRFFKAKLRPLRTKFFKDVIMNILYAAIKNGVKNVPAVFVSVVCLFALSACVRIEAEKPTAQEITSEQDSNKARETPTSREKTAVKNTPGPDETIEGQISDAGTEAVNNGGNFVRYGGAVYYREYGSDCFAPGGTETVIKKNGFGFIPGAKTKMMRLDPDGTITVLFEDTGHGNIFIYHDEKGNARFLLNGFATDDEMAPEGEVYSIALDGRDLRNYGGGSVFAVDEGRGITIASGYRGAIYEIGHNNGNRKDLAEAYNLPVHYDPLEGVMYCQEFSSELITLRAIRISDGNETVLFSAPPEETEKLAEDGLCGEIFEFRNLQTWNDRIKVCLAGYGVFDLLFHGCVFLEIPKNGSAYGIVSSFYEFDWFGVEKPFSFLSDGPFQTDEHGAGYFMFNVEELTLDEILTASDLAGIGLSGGEFFDDSRFASIREVEYVEREVFFTVLTGARNAGEDADHGYGYDRGETGVYRKDLRTGQVTLIYSY